VSKPLLHGTKINARPEAPSREPRPELVEPKLFRVLFRTLGDGLQIIEEVIFTLHPEVGNTKSHVFSAFAFHAFRLVANVAGLGLSRSLYAFGVQLRSGL
jgi:hypothetical protein